MTHSTIGIPNSANDLRSSRVLVVNADPLTRELYTLVLKLEGYDVETACDGADALSRLAMRGYDVVLTDRTMPNLDVTSQRQST